MADGNSTGVSKRCIGVLWAVLALLASACSSDPAEVGSQPEIGEGSIVAAAGSVAEPAPSAETSTTTDDRVLVVIADGNSAEPIELDEGKQAGESDSGGTDEPTLTETPTSESTTTQPTTSQVVDSSAMAESTTSSSVPQPDNTQQTTTTSTTSPTTTASTSTRPPANAAFPNDDVTVVSSGAASTFSAQVADGSKPVVVWYWLPG